MMGAGTLRGITWIKLDHFIRGTSKIAMDQVKRSKSACVFEAQSFSLQKQGKAKREIIIHLADRLAWRNKCIYRGIWKVKRASARKKKQRQSFDYAVMSSWLERVGGSREEETRLRDTDRVCETRLIRFLKKVWMERNKKYKYLDSVSMTCK